MFLSPMSVTTAHDLPNGSGSLSMSYIVPHDIDCEVTRHACHCSSTNKARTTLWEGPGSISTIALSSSDQDPGNSSKSACPAHRSTGSLTGWMKSVGPIRQEWERSRSTHKVGAARSPLQQAFVAK